MKHTRLIPAFALLCAVILLLGGVGFFMLYPLITAGGKAVTSTKTNSGSSLLFISGDETITLYPWSRLALGGNITIAEYLDFSNINENQIKLAYDKFNQDIHNILSKTYLYHKPIEESEFVLETDRVLDNILFLQDETYAASDGLVYRMSLAMDLMNGEPIYLHVTPEKVAEPTREQIETVTKEWKSVVDEIRQYEKKLQPYYLGDLISGILSSTENEGLPAIEQTLPSISFEVEGDHRIALCESLARCASNLDHSEKPASLLSTLEKCLYHGDMQVAYYQSELLVTLRYDSSEVALFIDPIEACVSGYSIYPGL